MSRENVEIVRRFGDAWQRGDLAAALSLVDDDVEWHDQAAIPDGALHHGPKAVQRHWDRWLAPWEEIDYEVEELRGSGECVLVVLRRRGRGKSSGIEVTDQVIHIYTLRNDRIVRFQGYSDKAEALKAAGLSE